MLELREPGERRFDATWQHAALSRRVRDSSGIYVLSPDDRFFMLLREALVDGQQITSDDAAMLSELAAAVDAPVGNYATVAFAKDVLDVFMTTRGYPYLAPTASVTHFNGAAVPRVMGWTRRRLLPFLGVPLRAARQSLRAVVSRHTG